MELRYIEKEPGLFIQPEHLNAHHVYCSEYYNDKTKKEVIGITSFKRTFTVHFEYPNREAVRQEMTFDLSVFRMLGIRDRKRYHCFENSSVERYFKSENIIKDGDRVAFYFTPSLFREEREADIVINYKSVSDIRVRNEKGKLLYKFDTYPVEFFVRVLSPEIESRCRRILKILSLESLVGA